MKICTKCKIEKPSTCFEHHKGQCKDCRNIDRNKRLRARNNPVSVESKTCGECKIVKPSSEFHISISKPDGLMWSCKACRNNSLKQRYKNKKEQIKARTNAYYYANKEIVLEKQLKRQKERLKTDAEFHIRRKLRNRLYCALKRKAWKKDTKFADYIGCTLEHLKTHLESKFTDGMSWENKGKWHIDHIIPLDSAQTVEELYKLCHYTNLQPLWAIDNIKKGVN